MEEKELQAVEKLIKTQTNAELLQRITDLRRADKRTIALPRQQMLERCHQAIVDWINSWDANWDTACCWHASSYLRHLQAGRSERWFQKQLSAYFNKLCKRIYAHLPVKQRPNIARFITLEFSERVGWHAHGIIATPSHMSQAEFKTVLRELWVEQAGLGCIEVFKDRLFWCETLGTGYKHYILKSAIDLHDNQLNPLNGLIDLDNTYRP